MYFEPIIKTLYHGTNIPLVAVRTVGVWDPPIGARRMPFPTGEHRVLIMPSKNAVSNGGEEGIYCAFSSPFPFPIHPASHNSRPSAYILSNYDFASKNNSSPFLKHTSQRQYPIQTKLGHISTHTSTATSTILV